MLARRCERQRPNGGGRPSGVPSAAPWGIGARSVVGALHAAPARAPCRSKHTDHGGKAAWLGRKRASGHSRLPRARLAQDSGVLVGGVWVDCSLPPCALMAAQECHTGRLAIQGEMQVQWAIFAYRRRPSRTQFEPENRIRQYPKIVRIFLFSRISLGKQQVHECVCFICGVGLVEVAPTIDKHVGLCHALGSAASFSSKAPRHGFACPSMFVLFPRPESSPECFAAASGFMFAHFR